MKPVAHCDDTEFVTLGGLVVGPKPFGTKGLSTVIKPVSFRHFMSVVVHRTVVPCERMALVPFPHSGTKYQDLITGRDIETSNNVHEFEKQCNYINGAQECKSSQARPVQDPMQNSTARAIIMKCAHTYIHSYVWHLRVSVFSHSHVNALAEPLCANCRAGYHERSCNYCSGFFFNPDHGGGCI